MLLQKAQLLLYLSDGQDNLEMYISKPFEYENATIPQFKDSAREAFKECCYKALEDHNINTAGNPGIADMLRLVERNLDVKVTIFLSGTTNKNCLEKVTLDDISPEQIMPEEALRIFESWVDKLRTQLYDGFRSGTLPLGEDFSMPGDITYYTQIEMGLTNQQKEKRNIHHNGNGEYEVEVYI